jgi:superfamily II DNA or RNA helicase
MQLRPYQADLGGEVLINWLAGLAVVLMVLDTGLGKTAIISWILQQHGGFSCLIVHRDRLVEQLSLTLARFGVHHDLICSDKSRRIIMRKHIDKFGKCFIVPGSKCRVASIDTLVKAKNLGTWASQVTLWIIDEGHHLVRENKWHRGIKLFTHPNCKGLLPTATPKRADKKGLGRHADGVADVMVLGPLMRWGIDEGYLCDYDVLCPPSDMVILGAPGASGDYSTKQHREAAKRSHIVGDISEHYVRWAMGKTGVTFVGDVETANEVVSAYRGRGVRAELVTGETDTSLRDRYFDQLERGEIQQIVAVDVISEGVDIPAVQVGSFGRLTKSLAVWKQQVGRVLRPNYAPGYDLTTREGRLAAIAASDKPRALLIDHTSAFIDPALGPPDKPREWTLDRQETRSKSKAADEIPMRVCANPDVDCFKPYPRILRACPHCGFEPAPIGRSSPEQVDGDLALMDPAALAALQGRVIDVTLSRAQFDTQQLAKHVPAIGLNRGWKAYVRDRDASVALVESMDLWAGQQYARGLSDHEINRGFYLSFGVDTLSARGLREEDAVALKNRIDGAVNGI